MEAMTEGALATAEASQGWPALRAAFALYAGFVDVARARAGNADVHLAAARARITALYKEDAAGRTLLPELATTEVRGMVRLLEDAIGAPSR